MRAALLALASSAVLALPASAAAPPPTLTPGELLVGVNLGSTGFEAGAVQGSNVVLARGLEIDLARELGKRLGIARVRFTHEPAFAKLVAPGAKQWDIALAQISITPQRERNVDFSAPYLQADQGVLLARGVAAPRRLADLARLQLCAERGTTSVAVVAARIKPVRKLLLFDRQEGLFDAIFSKRCEAAVTDFPLLAVIRKQAPDRYGTYLARIDTGESYGVVLPSGSALRPAIDAALEALAANGTLGRLQARWLGKPESSFPVLG